MSGLTMTPEQHKAYDKARRDILAAVERNRKGETVTEIGFFAEGLVALPPEIGQLTELTELTISSNQLMGLPPEIGQLSSLCVLRLSNNRLTVLPPEIGQLPALTSLFLSNNQLTELPPEIGQLSALTELGLFNNQLTELPPEIEQLSALTSLNLSDNQLAKLPPEIGQLTGLQQLYLHNNPGLNLPPEVLGPTLKEVVEKKATPASAKVILDHYFSRIYQGARPLNEVRLVFVGRGGTGKTSLVQRLMHNKFDPGEKETPGIALRDWKMKGCAGGPVMAHIWDFAGQVITHSMHRYFLSHRTVYILALTQREDSAGEDAEYWLKLIQSYGTDAAGAGEGPPVLVALNKWDGAAVKVDRGALRERYPFITGFVETDCASGRGIAELRGALCALLDESKVKAWVRQDYPAKWWQLKERIQAVQQTRPHLGFDEFSALCGTCEVDDPLAAGRDFHTLGFALNYGLDEKWRESLADTTVLRPGWVTHHCYTLIRHAEKQKGELRLTDLVGVLSADRDGVPGEPEAKMHLYLMRLMERFEAAYPLGDAWPPERWLVPLGLPDSQPGGVEQFRKLTPAESTRLRYSYPSVPPGLIAQFIVRTHPLMEENMQWASGTVLTLNGARALVRAVSKTEVEVTASGDDREARRDLAGLCREQLMQLHRQVSGLSVREETEVQDGERISWIAVPALEEVDREDLGAEMTALTPEGSMHVTPAKELDEFSTEEGRLPERVRDPWDLDDFAEDNLRRRLGKKTLRRSNIKPRVFISYSHQDERLRKVLELHLQVLKIQGLVHEVWHDRRIQAGGDWDRAIQQQLAEADVVLLLISTAALASNYINNDELRPALERHVNGDAVVVPIILEDCQWLGALAECPPLKSQKDPSRRVPQALPRDGKPIRSFTPQSKGWHLVSEGLKALLTEVKGKLT